MSLRLEHFSVSLNGASLIKPFSLAIAAGEIVTLMGPSGCGKSSLLSAIAGALPEPFAVSGKISVNGHDVSALLPWQRKIGRLFQDDLLFPHLTVGENLLFGMARGPRDQRLNRMRLALKEIELDDTEGRPPHTLSGGQRQRVALMRSLLARPDCMLLDEPFSKLDENLRTAMRHLTFSKLHEAGTPALLATHDRADVPKGKRVLSIIDGEVKNA